MAKDRSRLPKSPYEPKYPYNSVVVTESGHEIHFDDTPGKERIRIAHKSGSYFEIAPDGRRTRLTVGDHLDYTKGGLTITIDKNYDGKIAGSKRESVGRNIHRETGGDETRAINGDENGAIGKDQVTAIGGDRVAGVVGKDTTKIGGDKLTKVDGSEKRNIDGALAITVVGNVDIKSKGNVNVEAQGDITVKAGGTLKLIAKFIKAIADRIDLN